MIQTRGRDNSTLVLRLTAVSVASVLLLCPPLGVGAILEGEITPDDNYEVWIADPAEGVYQTPSWDIQAVGFQNTKTYLIIGIDMVGPFDRNGGDGANVPATTAYMEFRQVGGQGRQTVELTTTETTKTLLIDGQAPSGGPLLQWGCALGPDVELLIYPWFLAGFVLGPWDVDASPVSFYLRIEDGGDGPHDEVWGIIPEPASLGLLAAGAAAGLCRPPRRRRAGRGRPA